MQCCQLGTLSVTSRPALPDRGRCGGTVNYALLATSEGMSPSPAWTILAAAIPAMITVSGTFYQFRGRRRKSEDSTPAPAIFALTSAEFDYPPFLAVQPRFAKQMLAWHILVSLVLGVAWWNPQDTLPFTRYAFLIPLAGIYLFGAFYYGWALIRYRRIDLTPRGSISLAVPRSHLLECLVHFLPVDCVVHKVKFCEGARFDISAASPGVLVSLTGSSMPETKEGIGEGIWNSDSSKLTTVSLRVACTPTRGIDGTVRSRAHMERLGDLLIRSQTSLGSARNIDTSSEEL